MPAGFRIGKIEDGTCASIRTPQKEDSRVLQPRNPLIVDYPSVAQSLLGWLTQAQYIAVNHRYTETSFPSLLAERGHWCNALL